MCEFDLLNLLYFSGSSEDHCVCLFDVLFAPFYEDKNEDEANIV